MKKLFIGIAFLLVIVIGAAVYMLSGAGDIIKSQLEIQGSKYLGTQVTVGNVELNYADGKLVISDFAVANPEGFSDNNALGFGAIVLDLGGSTSEPYIIEVISMDAAQMRYEFNEGGDANLLVLKENLETAMPTSSDNNNASTTAGPNPLVMVDNVNIKATQLALDFENVPTGSLSIDKKAYNVTLPTFSAGSIGKPNGIPADQVGAAVAKALLDNAIDQAKQELKDKAKEKAKDKLLEKAGEKLKGLLGNG